MKKEEIIERIIDTFTDMGSESPEDTASAPIITIDEARECLEIRQAMERDNIEPNEWLPEETTPELFMEAWNCYVRKCRHDVQVTRLAEFLYYSENVDVYDYCIESFGYSGPNVIAIYPTDSINELEEFPFTGELLNMTDMITIGQNSPEFNPNSEYCYYDHEHNALMSTNKPYEDKLIDPIPLAEFILSNQRVLEYVKHHHMDNAQWFNIFEEDIVG